MTEQEYQRLQNLLSTVIEQQATFAENQAKADVRMSQHEVNRGAASYRRDARSTVHGNR